MECSEVRLKLDEYINNRLSREAEDAITLHLKECRQCCDEINILKEINELLSVEKEVYPGAAFTSKIMDIIEKDRSKNRSFILNRFPIINLGASLVLTGLLTIFVNTSYMSGAIREYTNRVQYSAATINTSINTTTNSVQSYITSIINLGGK